MIYFDNAATTFPKPRTVTHALSQAAVRYGANPGRAGHRMAYETAERVYAAREAVSDFFSLGKPENVIFTKNCTEALNIALYGRVECVRQTHAAEIACGFGTQKRRLVCGGCGTDSGDFARFDARRRYRLFMCTRA